MVVEMGMKLIYKATTYSPMDDVVAWCEQTLGKFDIDWYRLGRDPAADFMQPAGPDVYYFENEKC